MDPDLRRVICHLTPFTDILTEGRLHSLISRVRALDPLSPLIFNPTPSLIALAPPTRPAMSAPSHMCRCEQPAHTPWLLPHISCAYHPRNADEQRPSFPRSTHTHFLFKLTTPPRPSRPVSRAASRAVRTFRTVVAERLCHVAEVKGSLPVVHRPARSMPFPPFPPARRIDERG